MQICQNPNCSSPFNPDGNRFCTNCGANNFGPLFKSRYQINRLLGEGGFGKTYAAQDVDRLDAPCVIKQFFPQVQGTGALKKAAEMFKEEAKRLFELGENHPHIPRLIAYFEQGSNLYLVQEFIAGETLAAVMQRQAFGEAQIRQLLQDLLPILQFIHERNVIHRDIKPENIICRDSDRHMVLIDFGGAKQITQTTLARQGTGIYTVGYAPLEQMQGYAYPASDLYALGATCVRLLTRCLPLQDTFGNLDDYLYDISSARWLWRERIQEQGVKISDELGQILDKLLKHFMAERYQKAEDVLRDLNAAKSNVAPINPPNLASTLLTGTSRQNTTSQPRLKNANFAYVLNGQSNLIRSVVFSRDKTILVSGSNDKTIRIWNLQTGKLQNKLSETGDLVVVAISPNGQILISGSSDKTIKVWNLATNKIKYILKGHLDLINALCISPDGSTLASASRDKTIKIWQLETGKLQQTLLGHTGFVYTIAISPDGKFLASGGSDKLIKIWQMDNGTLLQTITTNPGFVRAVAISSVLEILASGGYGNTINLWNLHTGQLQQRLEGHNGSIQSLVISPDGQTLISGSDDMTIKLWNLQTGTLLQTLTGHSASVLTIDISQDSQILASSGADKTIRIWQTS